MIKISIICVGKLKEKYLVQGINEYSKRLSKFTKLEIIELSDEKTSENMSESEIQMVTNKEADRILSKIKDNSYVIALCIKGDLLTSEELSKTIEKVAVRGYSHISFIIGGSLGLNKRVEDIADLKLSFSKMTFPHQLMRLILIEQIYRAFKISSNEPYHK